MGCSGGKTGLSSWFFALLTAAKAAGATHADLVLLKDLFVRCQNEQQRRADS